MCLTSELLREEGTLTLILPFLLARYSVSTAFSWSYWGTL